MKGVSSPSHLISLLIPLTAPTLSAGDSTAVHARLLSEEDECGRRRLIADTGEMLGARRGRQSLFALIFGGRRKLLRDGGIASPGGGGGIGQASVHHALVVIFLEYFAWGLLTVPVINVSRSLMLSHCIIMMHFLLLQVLADTFPANKFLMNGLILGVKVSHCSGSGSLSFTVLLQGILSFLSAPLVGAMSDIYGRKMFLLATVFWTCIPIPCLKISPW